ncbi:serine hydrolase [Marivirga sp. S37H4]|uniref:Serine hydrolase n=1 Tax=Marivirga aurantiaca TaxID=2802615 RepID=A0A934X2T5_9BACT|nr:serine hydrolase [Marivirga aurantiaca]MBK6267330.1 serine hydrolase [Marivirga aurantiaca]
MIKYLKILTAISFGLIFSQCSSEDDTPDIDTTDYTIELLIQNGATGDPLEGASIQLNDNGKTVTTGVDGLGVFNENDLDAVDGQNSGDSVIYSFSISHPEFYSIELDAGLGDTTVIMEPLEGDYRYTMPEDIEDGLAVGNLEEAGLDPNIIHTLMVEAQASEFSELHSLLIYKEGKLVLEEYFFGNNDTIDFEGGVVVDDSPEPIMWSRDELHYVASVNKALTATLAGIALDANGLSTDALLKDYLPAYSGYFEEDQSKADLTFHHAMNMTLGFQWDEWGSNDLTLLWQSDDFADFLLSRTNNGPESEWRYNSASPNLVLKALENMVEEPVRAWAEENFYGQLGISDFKWQSQPDGYPEGAARMYMRPRDMLKVGVTYLNNGQWNGEQIIPSAFVDKVMEAENTGAADYSHGFWLRQLAGISYLSADGDGGNYINIFPDQNMVIVMTMGLYLQHPAYVIESNKIMRDYIFKAME